MHTSETSSKNVGVCRSDRPVDQWRHSIISLAFAVEWLTSRSVTSNIMSSMWPVHFQRSIDIAWSVVNHIGLTVQSQIINKEMPNCETNRLLVTLGKQILVLNPHTWMNVSRNINNYPAYYSIQKKPHKGKKTSWWSSHRHVSTSLSKVMMCDSFQKIHLFGMFKRWRSKDKISPCRIRTSFFVFSYWDCVRNI